MKKKINRHIHSKEKIICIEVPSWLKYWYYLLLSPLILPIVVAGLKKYSTHFVVTNKRVLIREGVFGERSKSVAFPNLTTVRVHQSLRGRLFKYGYIHLHTQTGGHADLHFHYLKNPVKVKKEIERGITSFGDKTKHEDE